MRYMMIYMLIGTAFGLWTAMNHMTSPGHLTMNKGIATRGEIVTAHVLVALAWPLSMGAMIHGIFANLLSGSTTD